MVMGDVTGYPLPLAISYSLGHLLRNPDQSAGGSWYKFYDTILNAKKVSDTLDKLKDGTYDNANHS